jgi:hypothetical protein
VDILIKVFLPAKEYLFTKDVKIWSNGNFVNILEELLCLNGEWKSWIFSISCNS